MRNRGEKINYLKTFFSYFTEITTGTLVACAVFSGFSGEIPTVTLWQVLAVGFLGALIDTIVIPFREYGEKEFRIRCVIVFILMCALVLGCGYCFGWFRLRLIDVLLSFLSVAAVFAFVYLVNYIHARSEERSLNEAIERRKKAAEDNIGEE